MNSQTPEHLLLPLPGDKVYYLDHTPRGSVQRGVVSRRQGPYFFMQQQTAGATKEDWAHRSQVLATPLFSQLAAELLSDPRGQMSAEELEDLLSYTWHATELAIRLQGAAMGNYLDSRSPEDFGVQALEDLVSTNTVRLEEFLRTRRQPAQPFASKPLVLARPTKDIEMLSPDEAQVIEHTIFQTNRTVLDRLYEHYQAEFEKAQVFEKEGDGYLERHVIYPLSAGGFYFDETTHWKPGATEPYYFIADIVTGTSSMYAERQYTPKV